MSKKEEENIFLKNQKIPETLDSYFKDYTQNGDYEMLINKARDYICEDTTNIDMVIHNLNLEKEQIEIDKRSRETLNFPISVGIVSATFTALLTVIFTSATKTCNNLVGIIAFYGTVVASFIGLYVFSKKIFDSMQEDKLRVLKNREKLNFLEFCIEEYTKKKQQ